MEKLLVKYTNLSPVLIRGFLLIIPLYFQSVKAQNVHSFSSAGSHYKNQYLSINVTVGIPFANYIATNKHNTFIGFQAPLSNYDLLSTNPYFIKGLVHTEDSLLQYGLLKIIDSTSQVVVDSFIVRNGRFYAEGVAEGNYILLAEPLSDANQYYNSTYYVNKTRIENAYVLPVNSDIGGIDLYLTLKQEYKKVNEKIYDFHVYPVPTQDLLHIQFSSKADLNIQCEIYDLSLREVYSINLTTKHEETYYNIDMSELSPGIYFMRLFEGNLLLEESKIIKL